MREMVMAMVLLVLGTGGLGLGSLIFGILF